MDRYGTLSEKKTFKGYHDSKKLLNTDKYFKLKDRETANGKFLLPWKKAPAHGTTLY